MRSSRSDTALEDIRLNIDLARRFIEDMTLDDFRGDLRAQYAVVRCLEIISEASRRLPRRLKERYPQLPWSDIAGAGNIYRHDYEQVAAEIVWSTVGALDELSRVVNTEIERKAKRTGKTPT